MGVRVVLEVAPRRAFASALDWPGWSRSGRTSEDALDAFLAHAPRYAAVARRAKVRFHPPTGLRDIEVVERLTGGSSTEFGAPGVAAVVEDDPISAADLKRMLALLRASWATFDAARKAAAGISLRLGPRGGGRQVPKIIDHVRDAEAAYLAKLGSRSPDASDDPMKLLQKAFADTVAARATGQQVPNPNKTRTFWSPRYAVRRAAWHVLDHAWEIEDRSP